MRERGDEMLILSALSLALVSNPLADEQCSALDFYNAAEKEELIKTDLGPEDLIDNAERFLKQNDSPRIPRRRILSTRSPSHEFLENHEEILGNPNHPLTQAVDATNNLSQAIAQEFQLHLSSAEVTQLGDEQDAQQQEGQGPQLNIDSEVKLYHRSSSLDSDDPEKFKAAVNQVCQVYALDGVEPVEDCTNAAVSMYSNTRNFQQEHMEIMREAAKRIRNGASGKEMLGFWAQNTPKDLNPVFESMLYYGTKRFITRAEMPGSPEAAFVDGKFIGFYIEVTGELGPQKYLLPYMGNGSFFNTFWLYVNHEKSAEEINERIIRALQQNS